MQSIRRWYPRVVFNFADLVVDIFVAHSTTSSAHEVNAEWTKMLQPPTRRTRDRSASMAFGDDPDVRLEEMR
jgi:hypothetical protein